MSTYKRTKRQRRAAKARRRVPLMTIADFHAHLDRCVRCESQPHNLCSKGAWVARQAMANRAGVVL